MDNRCVGVFDSGLGGLTCVKEIMKLLPYESIVYFGDTGRVPYGTRSAETIIKYTESDIRFLKQFDPKLIIIACGTASSTALEYVKDRFDVNIMGVVAPSAAAASSLTENGKIGVIGTNGSINSGKYEQYLKSLNKDLQVYSKACPMFVPLVENGYLDSKVTYMIAQEYLAPLMDAGVDTIILGCTHYPLIKKVISDIVGQHVALIDPGKETALYARSTIDAHEVDPAGKEPEYKFYISDFVDNFSHTASMFLQKEISGNIEKINIENYMV
ncbi:MAG: glutamate racemase [Bacillota bacterium]|nr:glutamate racemase [Bacillota bacterium]